MHGSKEAITALEEQEVRVEPREPGHKDVNHHIETRKMTPLIIVLTFLTSISGFMFGYDTGYISGALVVIGDDLGKYLSSGDKELITSATSLGAFISVFFAAALADTFGRKWIITGANILFVVGTILQVAAKDIWTMIGGRFVMGFGVGAASLLAPLYIGELAPSRYRGRLIVINVLAITGGQLIAYAIGAGLEKIHNGWKIMVGLAMVPAVVQGVLFIFMPETPRYLVMKHKLDRAKDILRRTYRDVSDAELEDKISELVLFTQSELPPGVSWIRAQLHNLKLLHTKPSNFRALIITCGMQGIQQFSGWNSLMYFSATVFQAVGFNNSIAVSLIISGTNFVFTLVAFMVIDRVGRRRILLCTIWGMSFGLILNAIAFHFLGDVFSDSGSAKSNTDSPWSKVVIVAMLIFAAFYATGIGNVPWQQSEMFPMEVRSIGSSFATATNWAGSLIVSATFLTMLQNITPVGTFSFYAGLCAIGELFVYFLYPETAGMTLEEVQELLVGGFNVKASVRKNQELKRFYAQARPQDNKPMVDYVETVSDSSKV